MNDPILDEIQRVRAEIVKEHGGLKGYLRYFQKLEQKRMKPQKEKTAIPAAKAITKRRKVSKPRTTR